MNEKYGDDPSNHPVFDREVWELAVGGTKKGRLLGFGTQDPDLILTGRSTQGGSSSNGPEIIVLENKVRVLEEQYERQKEEEERRREEEERRREEEKRIWLEEEQRRREEELRTWREEADIRREEDHRIWREEEQRRREEELRTRREEAERWRVAEEKRQKQYDDMIALVASLSGSKLPRDPPSS